METSIGVKGGFSAFLEAIRFRRRHCFTELYKVFVEELVGKLNVILFARVEAT